MENNEEIKQFMNSGHLLLPNISIDCVIFGFHDHQLKVLSVRFKKTEFNALPGGFVYLEEGVEQAARRILEERTGLKEIYLEQFYVFGQADRKNTDSHRRFLEENGIEADDGHWLLQRFISIGYYALVDFSKVTLRADSLSEWCQWFEISDLPPLIMDHAEIVQKALKTLRLRLDYSLSAFTLLPETFTMSELQTLYETIQNRKLLRTNFQRKILSMDILERIDKKWTGGAHKAPYLYRLRSDV